jgi:hypothetical protein
MKLGSPVGDLLRAFAQLDPADTATRARIAAFLGLELRTATSQHPATTTQRTMAGVSNIVLPPDPQKPTETPPKRDILVETVPMRAEARSEEVLGATGLSLPDQLPPPPPKSPLLNPLWTRGLFSTLLSLRAETVELDVPLMVDLIARGAPLTRVHFRTISTVSAGVRCYIDCGAPMEILLDDVSDVRGDLENLVGFERVAYQYFETVPDAPSLLDEPAPGSNAELPTAPDSPVLILSDFGYYMSPGRRWALPDEWLAWIERERTRGTTCIVGLTPVDPVNWPAALRSEIQFVHWDIETGIQAARRNAA